MMMNVLFFTPVVLYLLAMVLQFAGTAFKKDGLKKAAWVVLLVSASVHTAYTVVRGVKAGRVPLSNQFEFANAFALGVAVMGIVFRLRGKQSMDWMVTICLPMAFLLISYAALQPRDIHELMPALRSTWFTLHIGTAVLSYSSFALAACMGIRYLLLEKKGDEKHLAQLDLLAYKMVSFGFLMLSIVILSGCIWAEQAWSTFWSWDPKEVWALITWIVYAIYLHQHIRKKARGHKMAIFAVFGFVFVMFTFMGVNKLMSGLHSYA